MGLTRFCCCCDLRRGSIVFAWLQMMLIAMIVTSLTIPVKIANLSPYYYEFNNDFEKTYRAAIDPTAITGITICILMIGQQIIKGITCIFLTWGIFKKQHLFYQPWLFIQGIENSLMTLTFIVCFFVGIAANPFAFAVFIPSGVIGGLSWYFWFCIYFVYQKDLKSSTVQFEEINDTINLI